jgi:hypothetical protein
MKTATKIRDISVWQGDVALYELSEPLEDYSFVFVSAVNVPFSGPETYIFGAKSADAEDPASWVELDGSYQGGLSHAEALAGAGYEIA